MTPVKTLTLVAQFACSIPIIAGAIRFKRLPQTAKVFFYFMLFCAFTEWFAHYLSVTYHNSMPFLYVFTFAEFGIFSYVLLPRLVLFDKWSKQLFGGLLWLMVGLLVLDAILHSVLRWNIISRTTESIIIVFMSLAYILQYIQSNTPNRITNDYVFWIAAGAAAYFSISFFFILIAVLVPQSPETAGLSSIINYIHLSASILSYLFFAYSFRMAKPENELKGQSIV